MTQNQFRPLGAAKPFQPVLSRRALLGTSVAVPAALASDGRALAEGTIEDPYDVRFVEDTQGISVITVQGRVWRLHRLAFGSSTTFTLRTLQAGSKKGYELQIGGASLWIRERA